MPDTCPAAAPDRLRCRRSPGKRWSGSACGWPPDQGSAGDLAIRARDEHADGKPVPTRIEASSRTPASPRLAVRPTRINSGHDATSTNGRSRVSARAVAGPANRSAHSGERCHVVLRSGARCGVLPVRRPPIAVRHDARAGSERCSRAFHNCGRTCGRCRAPRRVTRAWLVTEPTSGLACADSSSRPGLRRRLEDDVQDVDASHGTGRDVHASPCPPRSSRTRIEQRYRR